jgi:hypothetical protein
MLSLVFTPTGVVMNMRVHNKLAFPLFLTLLLLLPSACSDGDWLVAPRGGLDPMEALGLTISSTRPDNVPLTTTAGDDIHEVSVFVAPGPDGVLGTDDDIRTEDWQAHRYAGLASPPGLLWHPLGVDLSPSPGSAGPSMHTSCMATHASEGVIDYNGAIRVSFLDPETKAPRTSSFVAVEAGGRNAMMLSAYDANGVLIGSDSSVGTAVLVVEAGGIAWADVSGTGWCLAHRVWYTTGDAAGGGGRGTEEQTAPELQVSVTPDVLLRPDHKYRSVSVAVDAGDVDLDALDLVATVVSSDLDNGIGTGDGNTTGDIRVTRQDGTVLLSSNDEPVVTFDPRSDQLELRAERAAGGGNRVYTIEVKATDSSDNEAGASATVTVPLAPAVGRLR